MCLFSLLTLSIPVTSDDPYFLVAIRSIYRPYNPENFGYCYFVDNNNIQQIWQKQFVLSVCLFIENCTFQDLTKKVEYKTNEHKPDADDLYSSVKPHYSEH